MLKEWSFWLLTLTFAMLTPFWVALGDVVPPVEVISIIDYVKAVFDFGKTVPQLATWGVVAGVVKLLVDATKTQFLGDLFDKLGPVGKRFLVLGLSALSVGTTTLASGAGLANAVTAVLASAAGAMLLHELLEAIKNALAPKS